MNGNCSYLNDMILDLEHGKDFYGQNCAEPIIIAENITIDTSSIQTIGSNKDTLKFILEQEHEHRNDLDKLIYQFKEKDKK